MCDYLFLMVNKFELNLNITIQPILNEFSHELLNDNNNNNNNTNLYWYKTKHMDTKKR